MDFLNQLKSAFNISTPLVAVRSTDPASVIRTVLSDKSLGAYPVLHWDVISGISGLNDSGKQVVKQFMAGQNPKMVGVKPAEALSLFEKIPASDAAAIVFFANAHMFWREEATRQAIWNLRDIFKARGHMLVMQITAGSFLPAELVNDVFIFDEPLPSRKDLEIIVNKIAKEAGVPALSQKDLDKCTEALIGLSAFTAEQTLAMAIVPEGKTWKILFDQLWEQKRKAIEQTRGLSVSREGNKFKDVGGCENAKTFFKGLLNGPEPPSVVVFMDEMEKMFAGAGTDTSGVTTRLLQKLLTWMEDRKCQGNLFIGPQGSGKTMFARAIANEAGILTVEMDVGGMQSGIVGSSEENFATGLKMVDAVAGGLPILVVGTCNSLDNLPPEVRRRFTQGIFFYDLPTAEEQLPIWTKYIADNKLAKQALPPCNGWTGAEIRNCCQIARRLGLTLIQAKEYIVPVITSAKERIENLRTMAHDKFISASQPGLYQATAIGEVAQPKPEKSRVFKIDPSTVGSA